MYPKIKKTVIINRAISGSGKTTMAESLKDTMEINGYSVSIHSTDNYFINEEKKYVFDITKLQEFHEKNQNAFIQDLIDEVDVVVCDNTNIIPWQTALYTEAARKFGYTIIFISFEPRKLESHVAVQEITEERPSAHGISEEIIGRMMKEYYIYDSLLDKNSPIDIEKHMHYKWNNETKKKETEGTPSLHFDSDIVIKIDPNEYKERLNSIGSDILTLISIDVN